MTQNNNIHIYSINGYKIRWESQIVTFEKNNSDSNDQITACVIYNYELAENMEYDIITGNIRGNLGIYSFGCYKVIHKKIHDGPIN